MQTKTFFRAGGRAALIALLLSTPAFAAERFAVLFSGRNVGSLVTDETGGATKIVFDYKNNGRGPTIEEHLALDPAGIPTSWTVSGSTTFGSKVDERFSRSGDKAEGVDATGPGSATVRGPALYVAQNGSP